MKFPIMIAAAAIAFTASASAVPVVSPGTPLTTAPTPLVGLGGDVKAIFMYYDAAHTDRMEVSMPLSQVLFTNKTSSAGDTVDLGNLSGAIQFLLTDLHGPGPLDDKTFWSDIGDNQGNYHAWIATSYADFNVGSMDPMAAAALVGLPNIMYIGWEDLGAPSSDWDYNDLIVAISIDEGEQAPGIPEPLTLSLVGFGLLGAFGLRRVKKKA